MHRRDLDLYITPVLQHDLAMWFIETKVLQSRVNIHNLNAAGIQALGLETMPTLAVADCTSLACADWSWAHFQIRFHLPLP